MEETEIPVIETKKLVKNFVGFTALGRLSMSVKRGRILAVIGPNGAGKSTLLRMLCGLSQPSLGEVFFENTPISPSRRPEMGALACMLDGCYPPKWASIRQILRLQAGASPEFDMDAARRLLFELELSDFQKFGVLSRGQRRWVLAVAVLASRCRALILDEPAEGLDVRMRRKLYEHVRESATDRGAAVILTSHILSDIERVADDVLIIDRGRELLSGEMETLREEIGELEVPAGQDLPENMPFEILASKSEEGQRRCWIRCKEGREKAQTAVEGLRLRFNISLEDLYLALVDKESGPGDRIK